MRILEVCAVDFTLYHFLVPLIETMSSRGHEVVAVCTDGPNAEAVRSRGIRVESIPFARRMVAIRQHIQSYKMLCKLLQNERFDIVHVHTPIAAALGRLAAWRMHVPKVVYTAHGFYFHEQMPMPKWLFFVVLEWLLGRITDVLFTQAEEDAVTARRFRLCRGGVIEAIKNGVDPARFFPSADLKTRLVKRKEHNNSLDDCIIVIVGRLVAEKGYIELFVAMREVEAVLWVVGERLSSDHAAGIDHHIREIQSDPKLANKIRFLGQRTDVPELLRAADIFVLPSHREGMPRSILEAMMSRLPVVATNIRGSREEVIDRQTGFLVTPRAPQELARALKALTDDQHLRLQMGETGRKRALEYFDERRVISRQIELLGL